MRCFSTPEESQTCGACASALVKPGGVALASRRIRRIVLSCIHFFLLVLLGGTTSISAAEISTMPPQNPKLSPSQTQNQQHTPQDNNDGDEEDDAPPTVYVNIMLENDGSGDVYLRVPAIIPTGKSLAGIVRETLGCQISAPEQPRVITDIDGTCHGILKYSDMAMRGRLRSGALQNELRELQPELLSVRVHAPEGTPLACSAGAIPQQKMNRSASCGYLVSLSEQAVPDIEFGWSYRGPGAGVIFSALGLVLFLPVAAVLYLRRAAWTATESNRAEIWFGFARYMQWSLALTFVIWWMATDLLHAWSYLQFAAGESRLAPVLFHPIISGLLSWLPPAFSWIVCIAISHSIRVRLRGPQWSRGQLVSQAAWMLAAIMLPLFLFINGLMVMATSPRNMLLWFAAAYVARLVGVRGQLKATGMEPRSITAGELRDRAFALASKLNVKLQQLYYMPTGKGQLANAFARRGNSILLTDYLLEHLSKREVDAVVAHELAHLKLRHPKKLAAAFALGWLAPMVIYFFAEAFIHIPSSLLGPVAILLPAPIAFIFSRRFEYQADAEAVKLTADPEASITSLAKLSRLNLIPIHWGRWNEKLLTHPSTLHRSEAIARAGGVPAERVPEILRSAEAGADHYTLPGTILGETKIFSSRFKAHLVFRLAWALLAVMVITPTVFASLARLAPQASLAGPAILLVGFAATLGAYYWVSGRAPYSGSLRMANQLCAKLQSEGLDPIAHSGKIVSFAPHTAPYVYEDNYSWDIGAVFLGADRVVYWGEETRFALRRDQITAIWIGDDLPGWQHMKRLCLNWKDETNATNGQFSVAPLGVVSTAQRNREVFLLADSLRQCRDYGTGAAILPPLCLTLGAPSIGEVTSREVSSIVTGALFRKSIFQTALLAAGLCVVCGLRFGITDLTNFVSVHLGGHPYLGSLHLSAWYVIGTAVFTRCVQMLPYILYRRRAPRSRAGRDDAISAEPALPPGRTGQV